MGAECLLVAQVCVCYVCVYVCGVCVQVQFAVISALPGEGKQSEADPLGEHPAKDSREYCQS